MRLFFGFDSVVFHLEVGFEGFFLFVLCFFF